MGNSQRSRTVYSVGEAIRLQRETLRYCSAMFGEAYLPADSRESLRREIARVLQITIAVTSETAKEFLDAPIVPLCVKKRLPIDPDATCYCWDCLPSDATKRMAATLGCEFVPNALAAGAQSAETNEDLAQSEGRQSGPNASEGNAQKDKP